MRDFHIERIANIVPHHCGDHRNCRADDCTMLQMQRKVIAKHCSKDKACGTKLADKELLYHFKSDANARCPKQSRFKGKIMNMGKDGQVLVFKEVTKRLNENNIDRVVIAISSDNRENYLACLSSFLMTKGCTMDI